MNITPHNIIQHELIGLRADVVESTNPDLVGIAGIVVDESKNMLVIESFKDACRRMVEKSCSVFVFYIDETKVKVDGRLLHSQPENRIQKKRSNKRLRMR